MVMKMSVVGNANRNKKCYMAMGENRNKKSFLQTSNQYRQRATCAQQANVTYSVIAQTQPVLGLSTRISNRTVPVFT